MSLAESEIQEKADLILNKYVEAYLAGLGDRMQGGVEDTAHAAKQTWSTREDMMLIQSAYHEGYITGLGATTGATGGTTEEVASRFVSKQWKYIIGARDAILHESSAPLGGYKQDTDAAKWYAAGYAWGKTEESSRWWLWTLMGVGAIALVGGGYYLGTRTPAHEYEKALRTKASDYRDRVRAARRTPQLAA